MLNYCVNGLLSGGSSAYLRGKLTQDTKEKSSEKWVSAAMQVNHLLILSSKTVLYAGLPLGAFGTLVKLSCVLTPAAIFAGKSEKLNSEIGSEKLEQFNQFYKVGVVVDALAMVALGNPAFGLAALAVMALDEMTKEGQIQKCFDAFKKIAAALSLASYTSWILQSQGLSSLVSAVSLVSVGARPLVQKVYALSLEAQIPRSEDMIQPVRVKKIYIEKKLVSNGPLEQRGIQNSSPLKPFKVLQSLTMPSALSV